jgi:hypothetical protein
MYVRGYLQGSENGRVDTIASTNDCLPEISKMKYRNRLFQVLPILKKEEKENKINADRPTVDLFDMLP